MATLKSIFWTGLKFFPYFLFFYLLVTAVPFVVGKGTSLKDLIASRTGGGK